MLALSLSFIQEKERLVVTAYPGLEALVVTFFVFGMRKLFYVEFYVRCTSSQNETNKQNSNGGKFLVSVENRRGTKEFKISIESNESA